MEIGLQALDRTADFSSTGVCAAVGVITGEISSRVRSGSRRTHPGLRGWGGARPQRSDLII